MIANAAPKFEEISAFQRTTIGAICDQFDGEVQTGPFGSQLHASDYSDEGVPVVMPQDMVDGRISTASIARVDSAHARRLSQHQLRAGDVVFSRRGDVSRFAVVTALEDGWLCGTGSIRIRLNCPNIETGYLRYFLQQDKVGDWLLHHAKGVTMPNLNTNIIRGIPFEYPPLDGQRRIAAILDKADALRRKRKRALDLFGSLNRSIFLEVAETAGEAKGRLGDLAEVLGGKRLPKGHDYCEEETGYKYLRVADIQKDNLRRLDLKNLKVESFAAISRYVVDEGNVVITIAGTIGATRYIDSELAGVNLTENAAKIVLRFPERADPIYLTHALQSDEVQKQIRASTGQVTIGKLALFRIEALELPLPSVSAQRRFSRFVTESRHVRDVLVKSANMTDSLFFSLQSRAFSGQL